MANDYFRFKQFTINQNRTAMKVGVDAVLLGSWAKPGNAIKILDIGTGTGLLALMMAQKSNAIITALEIDKNAFNQALDNIGNSPWQHKVELKNMSFQEFSCISEDQFDFIICNPPYFSNSIKAPGKERALARHEHGLPLCELAIGVDKLLFTGGRFVMTYPFDRKNEVLLAFELRDLFPLHLIDIKGNPDKLAKRTIFEFCREKVTAQVSSMVVRNSSSNDYTREYKELTKDFYLNF